MPHPLVTFRGVSFRIIIPNEMANKANLLKHLGLSEQELRKIWWFRSRMYKEFDIALKPGKTRSISAPDRRLKMLQRALVSLLGEIYSPRKPVHGFVNDRSVITNATSHLKSKFVLNLDIEQFFPSISENRVLGLLKALGVDGEVSTIIARLCSNLGTLPQGAPTSPILSNMICYRLDKELQAIAKASHCIYTRYADDITFSSYQPLNALFAAGVPSTGNFDPSLLIPELVAAFTDNGFKIHPSKTHYSDRYSRRIVTGIKINSGLNVDRRFVRNVRSTLFSIETTGLPAAQKKFEDHYGGGRDIAKFLEGRISWIGNVKGYTDPVYRSIARRYNESFPTRLIKINPTRLEIRNRAVWVLEHQHGEWAQGTAFFLRGVGLVTAAHCIQDALGQEIDVYHPAKLSNVFKVKVKKHHVIRDLAILEHSIPPTEYYELELATKTYSVGDTVIAAGYPGFAPGDELNVRSGQISSFSVKSSVPLIEVTQKLTQGMSGGPVFDVDDLVAGVIHKGGPREGRDFAVHADALMAWLKE